MESGQNPAKEYVRDVHYVSFFISKIFPEDLLIFALVDVLDEINVPNNVAIQCIIYAADIALIADIGLQNISETMQTACLNNGMEIIVR